MIIFIERNSDGATTVEWFYDTVDLHSGSNIFKNTISPIPLISPSANVWPANGTVLFLECVSGDKISYTYVTTPTPAHSVTTFNAANLVISTVVDSIDCCSDNLGDFTIQKTNNSSAILPNGVIQVYAASSLTLVNFEASIDGGGSWTPGVMFSHTIIFDDLPAGTYTILLRRIGTPCTLTYSAIIINTYDVVEEPVIPSLAIAVLETPADFVPVFLPILYRFSFVDNTFTIKSDGITYIDAGANVDLETFLSQLPYVRIVGSTSYNGNVKVTSVDNPTVPTKFYIPSLGYVADEVVTFIPIDRQIFQLFGETDFNVFEKIADISVAADSDGVFTLRCEGFLQSLFEVLTPAASDDISLGRKFYCVPRDYDLSLGSDETNPICTAVYGTMPLAPYLDDLVPLGPTPINFIDPNTGLGHPVIFSFLNSANQRVTNVISAADSDIVTASDVVMIQALPGNTYTVTWISPTPFTPVFSPALPAWITITAQTSTSITLQIESFTGGDVGDYGSADYSALDYLIDQLNAIVGCYTFQMFDGAPGSDDEPVFTLTTCIFPTQLLESVCGPNLFNIAWVNRQGGWQSYIFKGTKKHGRDVGKVSTFKKVHELKKSSVEEVYDTVEVLYSQRSTDALAFITMLRTSIQAYLYNDASQAWDIPIVIDKSNFGTYQTPYRQGNQENSFTFKYADEVVIQRQ